MRTTKFIERPLLTARRTTAIIAILLAIFAIIGLSVLPAYAAQPQVTCPTHKSVQNWTNPSQVAAHGFFTEVFTPSAASVTFTKDNGPVFLNLNLATTNTTSPVASRITEIDTSFPVDQRVKCWQPDENRDVVVDVTMRFAQASPPPGLTENVFLWNAPFGPNPSTLTSIGVTRSLNPFSGQQEYNAIVAQDLDFGTFSGLLLLAPVPSWLDATAWHTVRITVTNSTATIEVLQGTHSFTQVISTPLLHRPEPLGFELSVDNEVFPGVFAPVFVPDTLTVGSLDISATP